MRNIKYATDREYKNRWFGQTGLVLGRGSGNEYERNSFLDGFRGKVIGCNEAYKVRGCDAIVYMDEDVFFRNREMYGHLAGQGTTIFGVNPIYPLYGVPVEGLLARTPERCSTGFDQGFYPCNLSGYVALNVALIMGLNPVWLSGFDPERARMSERDKMIDRSTRFGMIADWCHKENRQVYCADPKSMLAMFFTCKEIPIEGTGPGSAQETQPSSGKKSGDRRLVIKHHKKGGMPKGRS